MPLYCHSATMIWVQACVNCFHIIKYRQWFVGLFDRLSSAISSCYFLWHFCHIMNQNKSFKLKLSISFFLTSFPKPITLKLIPYIKCISQLQRTLQQKKKHESIGDIFELNHTNINKTDGLVLNLNRIKFYTIRYNFIKFYTFYSYHWRT